MIVSPSILAAKAETLVQECKALHGHGADWIHIDIMDGVFVPATTFGPDIVSLLKKECSALYRDVHFMVADPLNYALPYIASGAESVTFHVENYDEAKTHEAIAAFKKLGVKVGLSLKPNTPVEAMLPFLNELDLVLVMSVEPGKGGQSFLESALDKIAFFKQERERRGLHYQIEVDGGINAETGPRCAKAGVDILVAGSYLFGKDDMKQRMEALTHA